MAKIFFAVAVATFCATAFADQTSFDCAMRKYALEHGRAMLPRKGDFDSLMWALNLGGMDPKCNSTLDSGRGEEKLAHITTTTATPPPGSIYVAADGDDTADGTLAAPLRSVQIAADRAAQTVDKTVVLRGGVHYLPSTLMLGPQHSHITIQGMPGEAATMSGGVPLNVQWKPFNQSSPHWDVSVGQNNVYAQQCDNTNIMCPGKTDDAPSCQALCVADSKCTSYTWHDSKQGAYANACIYRRDGVWNPTAQAGHTSGHITAGANVYVANIKGQVDKVPGLQIDGARATRARYPNLPGGIEASCGYGCMIPGGSGEWTPPDFNKYGPVQYYTDSNPDHDRNDTANAWFQHYMIGVDGLCSVYDPPVGYWCSEHPSGGGAFAFRTPSGVTPKAGALPHSPYNDVSQAIFNVWRPARWANWMFEVGKYDKESNNFTFGYGGFQGARGNNAGGDFFVENVFEELDNPGEFFFNETTGDLFLFYNGTGAPPADATIVAPQKKVLVNLTGTQWNPVKGVKLSGVRYTASAYTYMEPHGVPSAGDWALERFGAVYLQGTEEIVVDSCSFERLDGNGVFVSGYNRNATVQDSDFEYIGGNAIAAWGYTNETKTDPGRPGIELANAPQAGVDGTDGEHPRYTTVLRNLAREVGLYEKQSSFFVQAKTAQSIISGNVFFNGPRAGINSNDGFGGGDEISHNLVFSTCRESGDHGPFNSWDRQPFLTTVRTGEPSMTMKEREIHHNFFVDNYSPQENVDNDDGSSYYNTHDNFFVYGGNGMKNDFGGHDNNHHDNIYGYVGQAIGLYDAPMLDGHEDHFTGNKVVLTGSHVGAGTCSGTGKTILSNNQYFTKDGKVTECQKDLVDWQKDGNDQGSTVAVIPSDETIIGWAKQKLNPTAAH